MSPKRRLAACTRVQAGAGAKKSPDGSVETPVLSDDYGNPKRYIIDVGGCIVGVID